MNFENRQSPSEVRNANNYKMDRFSETIILYGVAVGTFIFLDFFTDHYIFTFSLVSSSILFYVIEKKITDPIDDIISTSKYLNCKPKCLIFWGFNALGLSIIFLAVYTVFSFPGHPYLYLYIKSVALSGSIFFFSGFSRSFLVITSLVTTKMIRKGFFAIFQTICVLIRCLLITYIWCHYMIKQNFHFLPILVYLAIKLGSCYMILKQIYKNFQLYKTNASLLFTPAPSNMNIQYCPICMESAIEPIILSCNHCSCYECIHNWAKARRNHVFCPICRKSFDPPVHIEMENGYIPVSFFFIAF